MTTVNRSIPTYVPRESSDPVIPVQVGTVYNLTPAITPGGRGVLAWVDPNAHELRCAVFENPETMFAPDVVEPGDVRTIWAEVGRSIWAGTIAVIGAELLAFVSHFTSAGGVIECYVADDPEDPSSWSLRSTVQSQGSSSSAGGFDCRQAGPPTVLPSGRWLLPMHAWRTITGSLIDGEGLHTSDDQGATWTTRVNQRTGALFSLVAGPQSTTIAYRPAGAELVMGSYVGPVWNWHLYRSSDGGTSWPMWTIDGAGHTRNPHFFVDNGTKLFALLELLGDWWIYEVDDPTDIDTWTAKAVAMTEVGGAYGWDHGRQAIPLPLHGRPTMVFTARDKISRERLTGFLVGAAALG